MRGGVPHRASLKAASGSEPCSKKGEGDGLQDTEIVSNFSSDFRICAQLLGFDHVYALSIRLLSWLGLFYYGVVLIVLQLLLQFALLLTKT